MALKAMVTTEEFDALPEDVQKEYGDDRDGQRALMVTPVAGLELQDVAAIKTSLQKERGEVTKLKGQLKTFDGIEPEAARDALSKVKEMDSWDPDEKLAEHKKRFEAQITTQAESRVKQLMDKHTNEVKALADDNKSLLKQLEETLVDARATAAINTAGGNVKLLLPLIRTQVRVAKNQDTGRFVTEVYGADGNARLSPTGPNTNLMSIDEFVGELKVDTTYAGAFKASGASGTGSPGSGTPPSDSKKHQITKTEMDDPAIYRRKKKEAQKDGVELEFVE